MAGNATCATVLSDIFVVYYTLERTDIEMYEQEKDVVLRIRQRFPEEARRTDEWQMERGWEQPELDEAPYLWVEAFADRTTAAARAGNWSAVTAHTEFMAAEYRNGADAVKNLIDVAYAENLMWDIEDSAKLVTWPYLAPAIQDLYEQMWGRPEKGDDT